MKKTTFPIFKPSAKDAGEADSIVLDFHTIDKSKYWHGPRSGSISFGRKGLCSKATASRARRTELARTGRRTSSLPAVARKP